MARRQPGAEPGAGQLRDHVGAVAERPVQVTGDVGREAVAALQAGRVRAVAGRAEQRRGAGLRSAPRRRPPASTARFTACTAITR